MKVINTSKNTILGENIKMANTFMSRFLGLMPKKKLYKGEGLLIKPCNSIHMFFMSFPIDVLFIDKNNIVIYMLEDFKPWKISKIVRDARYVVELPCRTIKESGTEVGDKIGIEK